MQEITDNKMVNKAVSGMAHTVFSMRWMLAPFYVGLAVAIVAYLYKFGQQIYELMRELPTMHESDVLLNVISQVDITMVANLIVMTAIGGYMIFVDERAFNHIENKPRWMNGITSTGLKMKMCMSLVGVTGVHLLSTFMKLGQDHGITWDLLSKEMAIHAMFIVTTLIFAYIDILTHPPHADSAHSNEGHKPDAGVPVLLTTGALKEDHH